LQREDTLKEIVRLLGPEALPDEEKLILEVARMIKIGILQQNSFDEVDTYCSPEKQFKLMKLLVEFYKNGQQALKDGASLVDIRAMSVIGSLLKARMEIKDDEMEKLDSLGKMMQEQFKSITGVKVTQ
jgi:V/A-type H+-transporting ATPase subunit A